MSEGLLARAEFTTDTAAVGRLSRVQWTAPTPWHGRLSRLEFTTPPAPVADGGPDQPAAEPYHEIALEGSESGPAIPSVAQKWRQISGPSVTLSGAATSRAVFTAPGSLKSATLVFGYTVTGTSSVDSNEARVTVTVLPVSERAVRGGVEVPLKIVLVRAAGFAGGFGVQPFGTSSFGG